MVTATAQSAAAAAPKPQSPSPSSAMAQPVPDHPPAAAMTVPELEAAIAALPAKKDTLREAFDRLAACSPYPLPFAWEDLDAHISSLQFSMSLRFRQLRVLEAARPAPAVSAPVETLDDGKATNQDQEEEGSEEEEWEEVEEVEEEADEEMQEADDEMDKMNEEMEEADDKMVKDTKDEEEVEEEEEIEEEEEVEEADDKISNKTEDDEAREEEMASGKEERDADERMQVANEEQNTKDDMVSQYKEANEEQGTNMDEAVPKKASAVQGKGYEACREEQDVEEEEYQGEEKCAKNASETSPGADKYLVAACATMNTNKLVKFVCNSVTLRQEFPIAMRHAPDAAALVLRVVKLFLHDKKIKTNKIWGKCVGLIQCVPVVAAKPSAEIIEQAKRVAKDWKEMIAKPGSYGGLGVLASWGLLYFLITYDIVLEFDTNEIIRLFGTVPRKQQKVNTVELCKGLGLADRITDLIDYLIGNGQDLDAVHLAHVFNLVDKYPPLSLLKGYLEKAEQTVREIFGKNMTRKSQNPVIAKEVDSLRVAQNVVKQHITDSSQCSIILAEIKNLLYEYAKKKRGLANASTASTSNSEQQGKQSYKKRKKEEHEQEQEQEQQGQQSKPGEKLEQKQQQQKQQQSKPGEKLEQKQQQQKEENKPREKQQQSKPQETRQQHVKRPRQFTPKLPTSVAPAVLNVEHRGHFGHPLNTAMLGAYNYPTQPGWPGVQGALFAPQLGAPHYVRQFDPFYAHPQFYPR